MARSSIDRYWIEQNPPLEVDVFGLRSNTAIMGRRGWSLAIEERFEFRHVQAILYHKESGLTLIGVIPDFEEHSIAFRRHRHEYGNAPLPHIQVKSMTIRNSGHRLFVPQMPVMSWRDMSPAAIPVHDEQDIFDIPLFRDLGAPAGEELIVDPATVGDLLEQIRRMQSPEQADIRDRNRRREAHQSRRLHAQILSVAA